MKKRVGKELGNKRKNWGKNWGKLPRERIGENYPFR